MAEWKCQNPRCRHRIERHEILASGRVMCTDCECRDYVLKHWLVVARETFEAAKRAFEEMKEDERGDIEFCDGDQWPELPS